jgi:hypothetical protein
MYDVIYKKYKRKKKSKQFWRRKIIAKSTIIVCSKLANSPCTCRDIVLEEKDL